jgi:alanine-glyoxylate transaminase/serine-glyoxylate transaminase/serine-pyruvate transaminase
MDPRQFTDLNPPERILLGPGPSMIPARVTAAMSMPVIGHLDPVFLQIMDDVQVLLRYVFQTENRFTFPVSGTGSSGMETALANFIEPGDRVLIGVIGYFGERLVDIAGRYTDKVDRIDAEWGQALDVDDVRAQLKQHKYKLLAVVHGETSSGACQPDIKALAAAAHEEGALFMLDAVASLGGVPVEVDAWDVDVCFSGAQKAISASPGLAPITISARAEKVLAARQEKVHNWYLDLTAVQAYWGKERTYHHTAPIHLNYGLREALRVVAEEGLEARFARHAENARMLWDGLEELDIALLVDEAQRLNTLTTALVPPAADVNRVRTALMDDYNIEIAGGFGPLAGKIWRIGLMGHSAQRKHVALLLAALREVLAR